MNTKNRKLPKCLAAIMIAMILVVAAYETTAMASGIGKVNTKDSLNILADADAASAVVGQVIDGGHVLILEKGEGWTKIQAGEIIGWVPAANLIETDISHEEAARANEAMFAEILEEEDVQQQAQAAEAQAIAAAQAAEAQAIAAAQAAEAQAIAEAQAAAAAQEALKQQILAATGFNEEDLRLLASIIYCEAKGEPYVGKVAVGSVVLNRVRSAKYPGTIAGVIYQRNQFSPVNNGMLKKALDGNQADASCYQAALEALTGVQPVGEKIFFRRVNGRSGQVIGRHVFY